jgi:hypothetical protein
MMAGRQSNLQDFACLSGWNTPTATDGKGGYLEGRIRNGKLSTDRLDVTAQLTGWPTPTTIDNNQVAGMGAASNHPSRGTALGAARLTSLVRLEASGRADWLFCRDGKWRPVKSGTKPLANGVAGRVGQLRAYGNAIVAPVAEAFITAYMDSVQ